MNIVLITDDRISEEREIENASRAIRSFKEPHIKREVFVLNNIVANYFYYCGQDYMISQLTEDFAKEKKVK